LPPVRPEPVEGLSFLDLKEGQGFDKLSPNGLLFASLSSTGRAMVDTTHLGKATPLPASPEEATLDYVPNPRPGALYLVRFAAPEFTSLCPVTGQPDFAHLVIDYAPGETIVESKSLKLFLGFRNHCGFHEDVTVGIGQRLVGDEAAVAPHRRLLVPRAAECRSTSSGRAARRPRGWLPDQGVQPYRGRG